MNTKLALACAAIFFGTTVLHASVIDTTSTWNFTTEVQYFGEPNSGTYGQTFTVVGPDTRLDSFSFWMDGEPDPDSVDFAAYVMAWDDATRRPTGSILFESPMRTLANDSEDSLEQIIFHTGGLLLDDGQKYVAILSASNYFDGSTGRAVLGYLASDVYDGGGFFFLNNGSDFSALTSNPWEIFVGSGVADLAFQANFNVEDPTTPTPPGPVYTPEPTSLALWGIALSVLSVGVARRRAKL